MDLSNKSFKGVGFCYLSLRDFGYARQRHLKEGNKNGSSVLLQEIILKMVKIFFEKYDQVPDLIILGEVFDIDIDTTQQNEKELKAMNIEQKLKAMNFNGIPEWRNNTVLAHRIVQGISCQRKEYVVFLSNDPMSLKLERVVSLNLKGRFCPVVAFKGINFIPVHIPNEDKPNCTKILFNNTSCNDNTIVLGDFNLDFNPGKSSKDINLTNRQGLKDAYAKHPHDKSTKEYFEYLRSNEFKENLKSKNTTLYNEFIDSTEYKEFLQYEKYITEYKFTNSSEGERYASFLKYIGKEKLEISSHRLAEYADSSNIPKGTNYKNDKFYDSCFHGKNLDVEFEVKDVDRKGFSDHSMIMGVATNKVEGGQTVTADSEDLVHPQRKKVKISKAD